jgi:putative membrane protein
MNQETKAREEPNAEPLSAAEQVRTLSAFALVRTAFSSERALMAWMRTSVSLYSFGFTITKFVDYLEHHGEGSQLSEGPRRLGLALICMGILVLVLAVAEHLRRLAKMTRLGLPPISRFPLPVAAAAVLFVIGTATLIGIAYNWSP